MLNEPKKLDELDRLKTGISESGVNLTQGRFLSLYLSLPPLPEQAEIVRRVEALFAIADRIEARYAAALAAFDRLTPALLQKAFRGELVPQDPADEPASVLLERIQARGAWRGPTKAPSPPLSRAKQTPGQAVQNGNGGQ